MCYNVIKRKKEVINIIYPKNDMYLVSSDFKEFGDSFSTVYKNQYPNLNVDDLLSINVTFVVTERCNLRCKYCYESHDAHEHGKRMTKEVADKGLEMLFNEELHKGYFKQKEKPGIILEFIGGEPLLEIDLIDYITDRFKYLAYKHNSPWATNYMISISTNGLLYMTDKVQNYIKKNLHKISLSITIDGDKSLHDSCRLLPNGKGSFDIVEKAVKHNYERVDVRNTKLTIAPDNIKYLSEAMIYCFEDLGCEIIHANCVYENVWNEESLSKEYTGIFYNELIKVADYLLSNGNYKFKMTSLFDENMGNKSTEDQNYCGGNGSMLAIGPDGVCYPCLRFMEHSMSTKRAPFICGHVDTGLFDKKTDKKLCELCSITMSSQSPKKCLECNVSQGCGLCTAYNYDLYGTPNKRCTSICYMHKTRVLANCYFWNTLYIKLGLKNRFKLNLSEEECLDIVSDTEYKKLKELTEVI